MLLDYLLMKHFALLRKHTAFRTGHYTTHETAVSQGGVRLWFCITEELTDGGEVSTKTGFLYDVSTLIIFFYAITTCKGCDS